MKCLIPRNQYASLLQTHQTLRSDYQKLLSVTSELTAGLETVAQTRLGNSQQIDWKNVKTKISFSKNVELFLDPHQVSGAFPRAVQE